MVERWRGGASDRRVDGDLNALGVLDRAGARGRPLRLRVAPREPIR
jgi:hypothetical protein